MAGNGSGDKAIQYCMGILLISMQHNYFLQVAKDEGPEVKYRHGLSEFTDTADHKRKGLNTWQDSPGSIRDYSSH